MEPKYTALDIANYFLFKAQQEEQELLSNLKLQKLIYYAQGLYLAMNDEPLFADSIEAWKYGPVVPNLYHEFKKYGTGGIPAPEGFDPSFIDNETLEYLDAIFDFFNQYSAIRLMEFAHEDQCWQDTQQGEKITWDLMRT